MTKEINQIMDELKGIRQEIKYIKNNMPDKGMFLNAGGKKLLQDSYTREKEGKLISSRDLKKKLGL